MPQRGGQIHGEADLQPDPRYDESAPTKVLRAAVNTAASHRPAACPTHRKAEEKGGSAAEGPPHAGVDITPENGRVHNRRVEERVVSDRSA